MTTVRTWDGINGMADGRPVKFSQATWSWYFTDTNGDDPAEKVRDPNVVRETDRMERLERLVREQPEDYAAVIAAADPIITDESLPMATRIRAMQLLEDVIGDRATVTEEDVHSYCYDTQG